MDESYDIVVVGGGPAGSSAALQAARAGASVLLVEKEPEIATTVRTSGVTWMETIREFGIPDNCYNPVRNYGFRSPNNEVVVRDEQYGAAVLDVRATYRWLASQAEDAGAHLVTGVSIREASRDGRGGIALSGVMGSDGDPFVVRGRVAIDASGFSGGGGPEPGTGRAVDAVWRRGRVRGEGREREPGDVVADGRADVLAGRLRVGLSHRW